jgi:hypothetical protein
VLAALLELNLQLTVWQGLKAVVADSGVVVLAQGVECSIHQFRRLNEA